MAKLINKIKKYNHIDNMDDIEDIDDNDECEIDISLQPLFDEETGEIAAVLEVHTCTSCGSTYVNQIFTNGEEEIEEAAWEMGYREEFEN